MICDRTQGFYENVAGAYTPLGLKGHGGLDINCGFGSNIEWPLDGFVSNVLDDKHPASDGYWGIYAICQYKGQLGELCVGHCNTIKVKVGDKLTCGQVVATEGNHGYVFQDGVRITLEMQAKGDERGHHRHWQWRPLLKTKTFDPKRVYITSYGVGVYKDVDNFFYEVITPDNGFKGLSPDIYGIINDYESSPKPPSPVLNDDIIKKQSFVKILNKYIEILKSLLNN